MVNKTGKEEADEICQMLFNPDETSQSRSNELEQLLSITGNLCVFSLKAGLSLAELKSDSTETQLSLDKQRLERKQRLGAI